MHCFPSMKSPLLAAVCVAFLSLSPVLSAASAETFGAQLDTLRPYASNDVVQQILERAEAVAAGPVMVRSYSMEDMGRSEEVRVADARVKGEAVMRNRLKWDATDEEVNHYAERFALASSDTGTARRMLEELPLLAAAIRLTDSEACKQHLIEQLREVVTWKPFQRPGWTIASRVNRLPEEGDGVWLSTGALLQGLAIMDEILPEGTLPEDLEQAVRERVREEIELTRSDWEAKRSWYMIKEAVNSNQWVVPASGMVAGAVMLGREEYQDIFDFGVECLRKSMTVVGDDGSMSEGYTYAMTWTSISLFLASHFMEVAGDDEFAQSAFFKNFPDYLSLYFQPGSNYVNASDVFPGQRKHYTGARTEVTRLAALSGSKGLVKVLISETGRPTYDFFGLLVMGIDLNSKSLPWPPAWGLFERTRMFVWRSSWENDASGVWVRGGDGEDFHDNYDRGHVNFIVRGQPVLIESGTPGYALPEKKTDFDTALGHNVMRLEEQSNPRKAPADIAVEYADADGAEVRVNLGQAYPALPDYERTVTWTVDELIVNDAFSTTQGGSPLKPQLTWHFAGQQAPVIERPDPCTARIRVPADRQEYPAWIGSWKNQDAPRPEGTDVLETPEVLIDIESDQPFEVTAGQRWDHTIKFRSFKREHATLELSFPEGITSLSMTTTFTVPEAESTSDAADTPAK
ncbi:heparinase II/III family protein [Ruficoccus sp. ZRK36]|uniref:heparinase II/III domain-containing protein n=1 Tax=Ruficoccus sp. ZRK36 TaxID=2866311 RepID=UPI001C732ABB|nr:heparinase II/III family protein [Ruficoccus sp. ZRK36]QYY36108.1 heparinase II/III-family protein [Ruficoccus sp. ZRK36]